jgi:alpha-1,2-mannosyltransferase
LRIPFVTLAAALVFTGLYAALGAHLAEIARTHDFLNLYTGGRMALEGRWPDLHDPQAQLAVEQRYRDVSPVRPFVRPAFYAAILAPLSAIPFETAFWVWMALWWTVLAGCFVWAAHAFHPDAVVLGAMFLPAGLGIAHGQDCVLMLALMAASYALSERNRAFASGAVAGLMVIKFHLAVLFPVLLLVQRRWRMFAGFCAMAATSAALSIALVGLEGSREYVSMLTRKDLQMLAPGPELMVNIAGLLLNLGISSKLVELPMIAAVVVMAVLGARRAPWRLYPAAAASVLLSVPHTYAYDTALLLPGLWAVVFRSKSKASRVIAVALCTPLPYGMNLAGSPWAAATPVLLIGLLVSLAAEPPHGETPEMA